MVPVRSDGRGLMALMFFLMAACPGFWAPIISTILKAKGWSQWLDWTLLIPPIGAVLSPLILGAWADQRLAAQKVLSIITIANALTTAAAFWVLQQGESPMWFLFFLTLKALVSAPTWSILSSVVLNSLENPEESFGGIRVWGTVGWMVAGWLVSWLAWDASAMTGMLAAGLLFVTGLSCLFLPDTPPVQTGRRTWKEVLGFGAFAALKNRDSAVYFLTGLLFAIPLAAYYPYTALFLETLNVKRVSLTLSMGQITEIVAMLGMGWIFRRVRLKVMFAFAILTGLFRYLCCMVATGGQFSVPLVVLGIMMHGFCWTLFFEAGRVFVNRRVDRELRSQAQSLLTVVSGGLGPVIGILFSGVIYRWSIIGKGPGWNGFWLIHSGLIIVALFVFLFGYRGLRYSDPER